MLFTELPKLKIGALEATLPIIQGGMGVGISLAGLASAVANQGGIGVISATGIGLLHPQLRASHSQSNTIALRQEIKKAHKQTKGVLGVNILLVASDFSNLARTAYEEGIDLFFLGAGLPLHKPDDMTPELWHNILKKTVPIISSGRAARIICKHWQRHFNLVPDAFVIEGPRAGGHLGFRRENLDLPQHNLEQLLADVISEIQPFKELGQQPIALIVAGGIYNGADIFRFLQLGAHGIQMGTRFIATYECDASHAFKQLVIDCGKNDLTIIDSPVGLPGRAIKNKFLENVSNGLLTPVKCLWKCLKTCDYKIAPYCIATALINAQQGRFENGFAFAGENAFLIDKLLSVKELIDSLIQEYQKELRNFQERLAAPPFLQPSPSQM